LDHQPRKRFGQNFLSDDQVIQRIVDQLKLRSDDHVVEIGPGLGAITLPMLELLDQLRVIEIDRDLISKLNKVPTDKLSVFESDVLKVDWPTFSDGKPLRIVGNLPYNIGTPLLIKLAENRSVVTDIHVMLQKEVVNRLVAQSGTRAYGRLSVIMQSSFAITALFDVPPTAFTPAPKVTSAVARLKPLENGPKLEALQALAATTRIAFANKRKTLRNNFKGVLTSEDLQNLGIDPKARAESLTIEQFKTLAGMLDN